MTVFVVDKPGWCFDRIADRIAARLSGPSQKTYYSQNLVRDVEACNPTLIVVFWWPQYLILREWAQAHRIPSVVCLYDHPSVEHWKAPCVLDPGPDLYLAANKRIAEEAHSLTFAGVDLCEDGVQLDAPFVPKPWHVLDDRLVVGWTGSSTSNPLAMYSIGRTPPDGDYSTDFKGLSILHEAARIAGVRVIVQDTVGPDPLPHSAMPQFYEKIDVLACTSRSEGTPNPALEAMACGRPVVSTMIGVLPDLLVDGQNGFVATGRSVEAFVQQFQQAASVKREGRLKAMGEAARKSVDPAWSWDIKARRFATILESLVSRRAYRGSSG